MNDQIARLDDKLRARRESFDRIPVVDIGPLLDGSDKSGLAKEINWALTNAGFMYVKNHGIDPALIDNLLAKLDRAEFEDVREALLRSPSAMAPFMRPLLLAQATDPRRYRDLARIARWWLHEVARGRRPRWWASSPAGDILRRWTSAEQGPGAGSRATRRRP